MPPLHPALVEFQTELERLGFVVVCHGDYICVRLPLLASVRVHLREAHLHFEPRFGPFARGATLAATPLLGSLAVIWVAALGSVPAMIAVAFAGTMAALGDVARLVMTEGAMTRLQLLWTTRPPPREAPDGTDVGASTLASRLTPAALAHGTEPPSAAGRAPETVPASDRFRTGH